MHIENRVRRTMNNYIFNEIITIIIMTESRDTLHNILENQKIDNNISIHQQQQLWQHHQHWNQYLNIITDERYNNVESNLCVIGLKSLLVISINQTNSECFINKFARNNIMIHKIDIRISDNNIENKEFMLTILDKKLWLQLSGQHRSEEASGHHRPQHHSLFHLIMATLKTNVKAKNCNIYINATHFASIIQIVIDSCDDKKPTSKIALASEISEIV